MREWLKNLFSSSNAVSSKRIGFFFTLILIAYAVLRYTNSENLEVVLVELISFALVLVGAAVVEKIKMK